MEKLYFRIGFCFGRSHVLELFYDKIIYSECFGKFTKYQKTFEIDEHKNENFIKSLDILDVWSWKQSYINSTISDGIQWEFEIICKNGESLKTQGSNKFPNSNDIKPSSSFLSLINSLENLVDTLGLFSIN